MGNVLFFKEADVWLSLTVVVLRDVSAVLRLLIF